MIPTCYLCECSELRFDYLSVLITVISEMNLLDSYLLEHLGFFFRHQSNVYALIEVHVCLAVD